MIPSVIHQVWLHPPVPLCYVPMAQTYHALNPEMQYILWTLDTMESYVDPMLWDILKDEDTPAVVRADLARYFILHKYGGFYADMDTECLRPISILKSRDFICGYESKDRIGTHFFGCERQCPVMHEIYFAALKNLFEKIDFSSVNCIIQGTGPGCFTKIASRHHITPFTKEYFCPDDWSKRGHIKPRPYTYIVHHFDGVGREGWITNINGPMQAKVMAL